jgi:hypothetical protein
MGFRFHRSVRILPGVRVNLSKSGTSLSVGRRGATVNFSKRGTRTTVGIPGTGISYSETSRSTPGSAGENRASGIGWLVIVVAIIGAIAYAALG